MARRHRVAQAIDCFVPDPIEEWDPELTASTAALIAEAAAEVRELDRQAPDVQGLDALARQLLRQESVGSSRIENLTVAAEVGPTLGGARGVRAARRVRA